MTGVTDLSSMTSAAPPRGFDEAEFRTRTERAQAQMAARGVDALLLTTEPEVRYFTGFLTQFWESPTRPWYLVVPASGKPVAVIPAIGAEGMRGTWLDDIRTWAAPDPEDDGVSLLCQTLNEALDEAAGSERRLGIVMGLESHLRMPYGDFAEVLRRVDAQVVDALPLLQALRYVKSEAEIEKIRFVCELASDAFRALPEKVAPGMTEREVCKQMHLDLLQRGADQVPYLLGSSGHGSYNNIIMGPTDRVLGAGDVMIIDTGARFDGYFCDFDRNWAFGYASDAAVRAYEVVYAATEAGFAAAKPGATTTDVYEAMWSVMEAGGALGNDVGRLGHGLGMQLTEYPSNRPGDDTVLKAGVVLTLEPGMEFAPGQYMVHEENIVIRSHGAEWLSKRADPKLTVIA